MERREKGFVSSMEDVREMKGYSARVVCSSKICLQNGSHIKTSLIL